MINYPRLIVPGILFLVGSVPCAMFWTRKKRAFDQIAMDFDVSVGSSRRGWTSCSTAPR